MSLEDKADEAVARKIADLAELNRDALIACWEKFYGDPPPKSISQAVLRKALAHEIQYKAFGGMKATTRRALKAPPSSFARTASLTPSGSKGRSMTVVGTRDQANAARAS